MRLNLADLRGGCGIHTALPVIGDAALRYAFLVPGAIFPAPSPVWFDNQVEFKVVGVKAETGADVWHLKVHEVVTECVRVESKKSQTA